jgi:hypothetical protein
VITEPEAAFRKYPNAESTKEKRIEVKVDVATHVLPK